MLYSGVIIQSSVRSSKNVLDTSRVELGRPHSTAGGSEGLTVAAVLLLQHGASRPVRAVGAIDGAAAGGMQGHLVRGHEVDTLKDVDLSPCGPVGTLGPETGPDLRSSQSYHEMDVALDMCSKDRLTEQP